MTLPREPMMPFGPEIEIEAGQQTTDYRVEMAPRAILSGRVFNDAGDPVGGIRVQTEPEAGNGDYLMVWLEAGMGITDDRGAYRIGVPPGKYRIRAEPLSSTPDEPEEIRSDGTATAALPVTWFPQASGAASAAVVEAIAGREAGGKDIRMARALRLNVSGTVSAIPEGAKASVTFHLERAGNPVYATETGPDGSFKRAGLEPGIYYVWAETKAATLRSAVTQLVLSDGSVDHFDLALRAAGDLSGTIEITPNILATDLRVDLMGQTPWDSAEPAQPEANGNFKVEGVRPGRYEVRVRPEIPNVYVNSISVNGKPASLGVIDLSNGAEGAVLKIALSLGAAQVSGRVEGKSAAGWDHTGHVWLLADGADPFDRADPFHGMERRLYTGLDAHGNHNTEPESDGTFQFDGLAPGKYRLFAIDYQSPPLTPEAILKALERVEVIEIREGDRLTRNVKPLAAESADGR
jgi:hypothetical protein